MLIEFLCEHLKGKYYLQGISLFIKIILNWIFREWGANEGICA